MKALLLLLLINASFAVDTSLLDEDVLFSGPNCHNTALRAVGVMDVRRYIREDEMVSIITNSCIEVEKDEGAIGLIEVGKIARPMHAFVSLDQNKVLTKNGVSKRALIEESSFNEMFNIHKKAIEFDCKRRKVPKEECEISVRYYRCDKIESTKSEKLISNFYNVRENFFRKENLNHLKDILENDITEERYMCSKFLSVIQSLEIANWNNRGPEELLFLEDFTNGLKSDFQHLLCL